MYSKVIAKKGRAYPNPILGVIIPLFGFEEATGKYIPATKEMFPDDGEIFIFGGYNHINRDFQNNELFEINGVSRTNDSSKSCQYSAAANDFEGIAPTRFIPIIETTFDLANRTISNDYEINYDSLFFIKTGNSIYGPLASDYENSWRPLNMDDERFSEIDENLFYHIQDNHDCILQFKIENISDSILGGYILDLNELLEDAKYSAIYAGSKEDTINWAKNKLPAALMTSKVESDFLKKLATINLPNLSLASERQKFDAFRGYVEEANDIINLAVPSLFERYLETDAGRETLESFLSKNQASFFEQYKKDQFGEIDKELVDKQNQLSDLVLKMESISQSLEANSEKILDGVNEEHKVILKDIIRNEAKRQKFLSIYQASESLEDISAQVLRMGGQRQLLEDDITKRRDEVSKLEEKEKAIRTAIVNVKDKFFKEEDFATRLVETKIYSDILNNIEPVSYVNQEEELQTELKAVQVANDNYDATEFINEITKRLTTLNRNIEPNDIVNYLVSLHQNFLVILAGAPGVGKTSMVTKLGQSLGSFYFDRFLTVAVQKGWTSNKDLIGYYNPITRRYQPSRTGLYQLLKTVERDSKQGVDYPSFVLLDEANLSPIEHYWAEFSSLADDDSTREIKITDQEVIPLGKGLRFVATINYDHTTEVLSDRLISRAPIIKLTKADASFSDEIVFDGIMTMFEWSKLDQWLKPQKENYKIDVRNRFESIIKKLEEDDLAMGAPIIVSPRKQRAVEKYCAAAGPLMKSSTPLVALDYAVNQHILPLISGRGEAYKNRLVALKEKLANMPMSLKHLEKIIHAGDNNFKYYKFFF